MDPKPFFPKVHLPYCTQDKHDFKKNMRYKVCMEGVLVAENVVKVNVREAH